MRTIEIAEEKPVVEEKGPAQELRRLRTISAGLAALGAGLRERLGCAWHSILREAGRSQIGGRREEVGKKFLALEYMVEFRKRELKRGLDMWRRQTEFAREFMLRAMVSIGITAPFFRVS